MLACSICYGCFVFCRLSTSKGSVARTTLLLKSRKCVIIINEHYCYWLVVSTFKFFPWTHDGLTVDCSDRPEKQGGSVLAIIRKIGHPIIIAIHKLHTVITHNSVFHVGMARKKNASSNQLYVDTSSKIECSAPMSTYKSSIWPYLMKGGWRERSWERGRERTDREGGREEEREQTGREGERERGKERVRERERAEREREVVTSTIKHPQNSYVNLCILRTQLPAAWD